MNPVILVAWVAYILSLPYPTAATTAATTNYQTGKATFYSPGLIERVAGKRGIGLGPMDGYSTYPDCGKLGQSLSVSVRNPATGRWSAWDRKRIVDCSQPRDYARHIREGLIELSYQDAVRYGYARDGTTRIRFYLSDR